MTGRHDVAIGVKVRGGGSSACQFIPARRVDAVKLELVSCICDCLQRGDGSCPAAKVFEDGGRVGWLLAVENGQSVSPRSLVNGIAGKGSAGESKPEV